MKRRSRLGIVGVALVLASANGAAYASQVPQEASKAASAAATASPELVGKAVPVLTQFVTKSGGAQVGSLLAGALK
jgi:hypothetical protein